MLEPRPCGLENYSVAGRYDDGYEGAKDKTLRHDAVHCHWVRMSGSVCDPRRIIYVGPRRMAGRKEYKKCRSEQYSNNPTVSRQTTGPRSELSRRKA